MRPEETRSEGSATDDLLDEHVQEEKHIKAG